MIRNSIKLLNRYIFKNTNILIYQHSFNFSKKKPIDKMTKNRALYQEIENEQKNNENKENDSNTETKSNGKITEKLLCDIIGCKYYPKNNEIPIDDSNLVTVYDESDKLQGQRNLKDLKEYATSINKDIVLRNDKSVPPIVKLMNYKVELVKRLMKKLGRKIEKSDNKDTSKFLQINIGISEGDFNNKKERCREILHDTAFLKVVIPCNIDNNEYITKATGMLNNIIEDIADISKIKTNTVKKRKTKINTYQESKNPNILDEFNSNEEIKKAIDNTDIYKLENEKDLDYIDCMYLELESLLVDPSGIDYEKILEEIDIEGLIKGISMTTPSETIETNNTNSSAVETYASSLIDSIKHSESKIEDQIKNLEKQSILLNDKRKKLEIMFKIHELKTQMEMKSFSIKTKALKRYMNLVMKESYNLSITAKK